MGAVVALGGRQPGWDGCSQVRLGRRSDHGCHGVTRLLLSGADSEDDRLPWVCLFAPWLDAPEWFITLIARFLDGNPSA